MDYTVQVANVFEAETPEDAVNQMVAYLQDTADRAGYRVQSADGREDVFIDAEGFGFDASN